MKRLSITFLGIHYKKSNHSKGKLDQWAHKHYFCRKHLLKAQTTGWNKNLDKVLVMTSGEKYKTAIKDGRCVVHILADENTSFNSNFIGKFHNF